MCIFFSLLTFSSLAIWAAFLRKSKQPQCSTLTILTFFFSFYFCLCSACVHSLWCYQGPQILPARLETVTPAPSSVLIFSCLEILHMHGQKHWSQLFLSFSSTSLWAWTHTCVAGNCQQAPRALHTLCCKCISASECGCMLNKANLYQRRM